MSFSRRSLLKGAGATALLGLARCAGPSQLEQAISQYGGNPDKQAAARFLAGESTRRVSQYFPKGTPEPVQNVVRPREVVDADVITAQDIIKNVDLAFLARKQYAWAQDVDDHTFKHFVLPYRNGTNSLDQFPDSDLHWREMFLTEKGWKHLQKAYGITTSWTAHQKKLNGLNQRYKQAQDERAAFEDVIKYLNTDLWVAKEGLGYHPSNAQEKTLAQVLQDKGGRCSTETHFARMMLMAHGVPATTVRIPAWGKSNDNHEVVGVPWDNDIITFDALRPVPQKGESYWYPMDGHVPKVYVEEFGNWDAASRLVKDNRKDHPWFINFYLGTRSCVDRTKQYTKTIDLKLEGLPANKFTYASVLNNFCSDGLAAVAVEKTDGAGNATFKDLGCRQSILYFTEKGPAIAHDDQRVEWLQSAGNKQAYNISGLQKGKIYELHQLGNGQFELVKPVKIANGKIELELEPNRVYTFKDPVEKVWSYSRPMVPRKNGTVERY